MITKYSTVLNPHRTVIFHHTHTHVYIAYRTRLAKTKKEKNQCALEN